MSDVSDSFSAWETLPEDEPPLCIAVRRPVSPPRHYEAGVKYEKTNQSFSLSLLSVTFSFIPKNWNSYCRPFLNMAWQRSLLHVFALGQLCALLSLISYCFSHTSTLERVPQILFLGFACLAAFICTGSTIAFAVFSYMVEYRFHHVSVSGVYEKHRGYSFHIATAGSLLYVVSLFLSTPYTLLVIGRNSSSRSTIDRSGTTSNCAFHMPHRSREEDFAMRILPRVFGKGR
ncbi:hypothetical protein RB195_022665 [Necator americanus]|uniref:Clc-like protein n=1 Tax=Necator americanus TaxID=51031 RepID=A0ABR1EGB7_NECAM